MTLHSPLSHDISCAISLTLARSRQRLVTSWLLVPLGTVAILLVCWGVDAVISLTGIAFPASVASMVLLFLSLLGMEAVFGERRLRRVLRVVEIPTGFALKYINLYFVPPFVLLPLSPSISAAEVGKIVAVFVLGFLFAFVATVYLVRGLVLLLGGGGESKEDEEDMIPLTHPTPSSSTVSLLPPAPTLETHRLRGAGPVCASLPSRLTPSLLFNRSKLRSPISSPPLPRAQRFAATLTLHTDIIIYTLLLLLSLPFLYATAYTAPTYVFLTTLSFHLALQLPPHTRQLLHPVLVSASTTLLGIYIISSTAHSGFKDTLRTYKTGTRYLSLFRGTTIPAPGAADLFSSLLDASIVALALPMFQHRATLRAHAVHILVPVLLLAAGSLGVYPLVARGVGISGVRGVALAARSMTLALATPMVERLGGDIQLTAVFCVTTGVMGVVVGPGVLRLLGVGEKEYLVRGVAMGGNASAVGTAWLLGRGEVRAAAVGSVVMVGLGVVVIAASAVGAVRTGVQVLAGV